MKPSSAKGSSNKRAGKGTGKAAAKGAAKASARTTGARTSSPRAGQARGGAKQFSSRGAGRTGRVSPTGEPPRVVKKTLGGEQVEGRQAVRELLIAGTRRVREIWVVSDLDDNEIVADIVEIAKAERVAVQYVARGKRLEAAARTEAPQGVIAHADGVPEADFATLIKRAPGRVPFLVAVDGVTDPGNLGALLRSCDGAGVHGVVLPRHRAVHVTPTVAKAAAGAVEYVPMAMVGGLPQALSMMKEAGIWIVGLDDAADRDLFDIGDLAAEAICLVMGAEGAGLSRLVRERCDMIVSIPMLGRLSSLNVSAAAALATYEIASASTSPSVDVVSAWQSIGGALSRRTRAALGAVVVVTIVLLIGAQQLDFATGQDSYLDPSSQVAKDNSQYQSLFGGENMVVLFTMAPGTSVVDLFDPANVAQLEQVEQQLAASSAIQSVVSPVTLLTWTQDLIIGGVASQILSRAIEREPDPQAVAIRQQDASITVQRLGAAGEHSFENPDWVSFLLFGNDGFTIGADNQLVAPADDALVVRKPLRAFIPDAHHAILAGVLVGNAGLDQLAVGSDEVTAAFEGRMFDNATVTITGTPTFLTDINDYLQGGMLTLGGIAVLVMVVILIIVFKVRWRLLPLLGMAVGVAWGFGAFGFTGGNLSLVTIAGFPILIGLGIEFAIQVQNRWEEERLVAGQQSGHDPFEATALHMGPPLLTATIAAVIAFVTMRISRVPMVQDFGLLLAIGIVALLVAGIVLPISIIGARERRSPTTHQPPEGWVERSVAWLGSLPRVAVLPLVLIAVALPVLGLVLETGSRIESDPINWANQGSTSIRNAGTLEHETGFATTLGVFVQTTSAPTNGVFTDQAGAFVFDLVERSLAENPELAEASSLATTAGWLAEVPGTTALPPTGVDMLQAYEIAPPALQQLLVAEDGNATQVLFQAGPSSLEQRAVVLDKVQQAIADPGSGGRLPPKATATTGGLAVVGVGLLENITANRAQLTIVALLLVGAFVVLRHRDLVRGLLTMIPVLLAVGTSAVLVRLLGVTLSPLTTVGGPLVVATCAEFAVLLVDRYVVERAQGLDPDQSNTVAARSEQVAVFFTSALTTLGGFAVLMFSTLPLLRDFGVVVTINIAVALLAALVVVPPLIKEADRRGLLAMGPESTSERTAAPARRRSTTGVVAGAVLAIVGFSMAAVALNNDRPAAASPLVADGDEAPATLPPPVTVAPTTPSTAPPSTIAGETTVPPTTLPPGPAERPTGLVGGAFYDGLVAVGVEPGVARCAADDLVATTPEADLLALGIASVPRPPEVNALLDTAAKRCGVTQAQLDAAAAAAGG